MAYATTKTLLGLDRFAELVGIHPLHFNQVVLPSVEFCGLPFYQYTWQNADRVGREEIAQGIAEAERQIEDVLRYKLAPSYEEEYFTSTYHPNGLGVYPPRLMTKWGKVWYGGKEATSLIHAAGVLVYSDGDSDGYNETAQYSIATSVTDVTEILVAYPGTSGLQEITPSEVVIQGGNVYITIPRGRLVLNNLVNSLSPSGIDGNIDANFLTTVDIYRRYHDPSVQAQLIWVSTLPGQIATQEGALTVKSDEVGCFIYQPAAWNTVTQLFDATCWNADRLPDRVRIWYLAGDYDVNNTRRMRPTLELAVARLALSGFDRPLCACSAITNYAEYWAEDQALVTATQALRTSHNLPSRVLGCPFGTRRGQLYAWEVCKQLGIGGEASA
jgi:hypothetical protein